MRLSRLAHERVAARDVWVAIALATIAVCAIGAYVVQTGHAFHIGRGFYGGLLIFVWTLTLISLRRSGKWRPFTWRQALFLGLATIFAGGNLWPHPPAIVTGAASVACLLLAISSLFPFIDFRKARAATERIAIRGGSSGQAD